MMLLDALTELTVEQLKERVALLQTFTADKGPGPQKAKLIAWLHEHLTDAGTIAALWELFGPLDRQFIASALARGGPVDERAFLAQFQALPESTVGQASSHYRRASLGLLNLLFYHPSYRFMIYSRVQPTLPDDVIQLLIPLAPEPERFQLAGTEQLPESVSTSDHPGSPGATPCWLVETEVAGWHDLLAFLRLVQAGELAHSAKSRELTAGSVRKVLKTLLNGDLLQEGETSRSSVRPYGLNAFAQGAGLLRGSSLSPRGRAVLAGDVEQLLLGFEDWTGSAADEFARVRGVKGQGSRRMRFTAAAERRENVLEALSWCPVGEWLDLQQFFRAVKAWQFGFEIAEAGYSDGLYVGDVYYGGIDSDSAEGWQVLQGSYITTLLFELLAPLGAVDVLYQHPVLAETRGYDLDGEYLALSSGLLSFRITPLGAYLFGQAASWQPRLAYGLEVHGDLTVSVSGRPTSDLQARLAQIAVPEGLTAPADAWRLDAGVLLASLNDGLTLQEVRSFLLEAAVAGLPGEVDAWLAGIDSNSRAARVVDQAVIMRIGSSETMQLILADKALTKAIFATVGDSIVVPARQEAAFRKALRKHGFGAQ